MLKQYLGLFFFFLLNMLLRIICIAVCCNLVWLLYYNPLMTLSQFKHPLSHWGAFVLSPGFCHCAQKCSEHLSTCLLSNMGKRLTVELCHMVCESVTFRYNTKLEFNEMAQFILPAMYIKSYGSTFSPVLSIISLLHLGHSTIKKIVSHEILICISLITNSIEHFFMHILYICVFSSAKCLLLSIFLLSCLCYSYWFADIFTYFDNNSLKTMCTYCRSYWSF